VALVGESGSGKSVSAMSIVRLLPENAILGADSKDPLQRPQPAALPIDEMRALRGKDISVVFPGAHELAQPGVHGGRADCRGAAHPPASSTTARRWTARWN
jgi:ABC-type microcin C transport system duplicated ATPase subunit YejF